ncbi:hypothetical protein THRCLA_03261, partial [Thraustotheca clavata]
YKEALHEHAKTLGLDPVKESQYLWIVEESLTAPLPEDWEQGETDDGTVYYFNVNTEESVWEHPMDGHYRDMIVKKKEEDAKKLAFNNAPKKELTKMSSVHEFDIDTIETIPSKHNSITSTTSKTTGAFGKDSKAWLLEDDDEFDMPTTPTPATKGFSIVSTIKKTEVTTVKEPTVIKPATIPTPTPLLSTSSTSNSKELEKQIENLKAEIGALKKERDTHEAQEKKSKDILQREIDGLRKCKDQAETDAKEANYLRMKITELKSKITSLENQATMPKDNPDATKMIDSLHSQIDSKNRDIIDLEAKFKQAQDDHVKGLQKKEEALANQKKEHSIEVEALQEQLLLRQATNITLQHSTGELEKLKKRITELEIELDASKGIQTDQNKAITDLTTRLEEANAKLLAEQKKLLDTEAEMASLKQNLRDVEQQSESFEAKFKLKDKEILSLETICNDIKEKLRQSTLQCEGYALQCRRAEDKERVVAQGFTEEKRALELSSKAWQEKAQSLEKEIERHNANMKAEKDVHVQALSRLNDKLDESRREKDRIQSEFAEVHILKKENETLSMELGRLKDQKASIEYELRNVKQSQSVETSQLMQYKVQLEDLEYDITRAEEKFTTAEKWRLKEVSRVEQRDVEILELKEELGRAKSRNIEGENHHLINELRSQNKLLEQKLHEFERNISDISAAKAQAERHFQAESDNIKKQWSAQIPQLAAAATQSNKHLMEQLHTIRVYLTQRPLQNQYPPAPPAPVYPSQQHPVADAQLSNHLQHQLGVLHAQFQQLFEATTPRPTTEKKPTSVEIPEPPPASTSLFDEKQQLIQSMEELGQQQDWVPVVDDRKWSKELEANRKPGQKHPTPSPGFADRVFYESLLRQNPESKMAKKWCIEYGVLEWDEAAALCNALSIPFKAIKEEKKTGMKKKKSNIVDDTVDDVGLHNGSHMEGVGIGGI